MAANTKPKDKYIVSFNSDTSDSEDESDNDVKPSPTKPLPGGADKDKAAPVLMNGHVGRRQNGDAGESLAVISTPSKVSKSATDKTVDTLKDCTPSPKVNGSLLDLDSFTVKKDQKTDRSSELPSKGESKGLGVKTGASKSEISSSFDLLSSDRSRGSDYNSAPRKGKSSDSNDLESAYSRAKEKNSYLARSSGKNMDQDKSNLLIDFTEASDNFESTTSKVGRSEAKNTPPISKPGLQKSYSAEFESEMAGIFDKGSKSGLEPITNGKTPMDFRDVEVKQHETSGDLDFDADLLIYASPGTTAPKSKFSFDLDGKTDNGPKRSFNVDADLDEKPFRRQNSKPDERESLLSPKEKYRNLDEKFSAICSKYGRDTKRDIPQERTKTVEDDDMDIYGTVKVKTTKQETSGPSPRSKFDDDEDLGFSEDKAPRQKLNFDDIVGWKKESTDDLIQRILADARNESSAPKTGITKDREPRDYAPGAENRFSKLEPYEKDMGGDRKYDYGQAQPSLLERRLAALGGQDKHQDEELDLYSRPKRHTELEQYGRPRPSYQDDSEQFYKRKTRGSSAHREDMDTYSVDSGEVARYIPWKERQRSAAYNDDEDDLSCGASACGYQSHLLRPPARYDADSESDDESYRSTRDRDPVLPDEWFTPQRHEETAVVVRERTMEVRNMVDNQTEVLGRLKKAADSFSDLDAEIRALKQQCIENQVARQAIIEDILHDMKEDNAIDDDPVPTPRRYTRGSYKSGSYSSKYNTPYTPSHDYSRSREGSAYRSLDGEHDSDRLGGYALGSVAKSKWGEPGGSRAFRSASVSRFDNVEKEHSYDKYGLYNSKRSMRAGSCVDDYDGRSEYSVGDRGDDGDTASVRSFHSDKNTEDKDEDSKSSYRSRQAPKYGSYLTPTTYDTPSYSRYSSSTREARSPTRRTTSSSTSDCSFDRPRTRGMSLPPPEKPFTSRFLSKVREKKASGADISTSRDKPFKSRFLTRSFDSDYHSGSSSRGSLASTPDRNSYTSSSTRTYSSRKRDTDTGSEGTAVTAE